MNKPGRPVEIALELTAEQRGELQQLAREAIGRVSERAHFVLLSGQGKSVPEIAVLMGYTAQAIYPWLVRYQQKGIAGLFDEPRSGRPPNERDLVAIVQAQAGRSSSCRKVAIRRQKPRWDGWMPYWLSQRPRFLPKMSVT